jgi:AraC-like DNA-binding protein
VVVSPSPANDLPAAATVVAMREGSRVRAGSHVEEADDIVTPWHTHELHQLQYAFAGVAEVETAGSRYLLPPRQAAWIPAGLAHQTTLRRVRSVAVFFEPGMVTDRSDRVRVLSAAAPLREMITYSMRWPITRPASDATADAFFDALALLATDWIDTAETPVRLPTSTLPTIRDVMDYTQANLATACAADVCAAVGVSGRSLRRQFVAATGMTWQHYRLQCRVLRSMAMLAEGHHTVLETACAVGFDSVSAFTRAFQRLTGEPPRDYRRRIASRATGTPT